MTDDRLDGGAALHLALDGGGSAADLAGNPDPELVRMVVPAIAPGSSPGQALVDMTAFDLDAGHALDIHDRGIEGMAVERVSV
jgi:hypothetical protein